jgi:hypothetical protein
MKNPLNIDPKSELNREIRRLIKDNIDASTDYIDLLLKNMSGHGESRFGVKVDIEFAANIFIDPELKKPKRQILNEFSNCLDKINNAWLKRIQLSRM